MCVAVIVYILFIGIKYVIVCVERDELNQFLQQIYARVGVCERQCVCVCARA